MTVWAGYGRSVSSPARGLDDEHVAGFDVHRIAAAHGGDLPAGMLDPVPAERARLAAGQAERRDPAVPGQRADDHRLVEPQPPDASVAAAPAAPAAAARPDPVGLKQHRVAPLE